MQLLIPFYTNSMNDCGPIALQMVLEFLGEKHSYIELKQLTNGETNGVTFSLGLAYAAANLGFNVEFYSKKLGFNKDNFDLGYYKKETSGADSVENKLLHLQVSATKAGVVLCEKTLLQEEILSRLNKDCMIIVLFDWLKISSEEDFENKGYLGHFMPIVGFDEKNIVVHQPGPIDPTPCFEIPRDLFDVARTAKGTDQDIIFIHRKS